MKALKNGQMKHLPSVLANETKTDFTGTLSSLPKFTPYKYSDIMKCILRVQKFYLSSNKPKFSTILEITHVYYLFKHFLGGFSGK